MSLRARFAALAAAAALCAECLAPILSLVLGGVGLYAATSSGQVAATKRNRKVPIKHPARRFLSGKIRM